MVSLREGSRHSGHYGAVCWRIQGFILAHALASIVTDRRGKILVNGLAAEPLFPPRLRPRR